MVDRTPRDARHEPARLIYATWHRGTRRMVDRTLRDDEMIGAVDGTVDGTVDGMQGWGRRTRGTRTTPSSTPRGGLGGWARPSRTMRACTAAPWVSEPAPVSCELTPVS
eukprot:5685800-Pyramimonas_sp.AAC.1